ncbi:MAG: hypothetical protein WDO69_24430 [Pseudomonadota bacterium]
MTKIALVENVMLESSTNSAPISALGPRVVQAPGTPARSGVEARAKWIRRSSTDAAL